jgi:hypothetical protein
VIIVVGDSGDGGDSRASLEQVMIVGQDDTCRASGGSRASLR